MNIYVSHLSWGTSSEGLGNLFMQFGEVASANVITDRETGRSRGFGFVEMPNEEEGQKAIDQLNGTNFEGQTITVNVARPREDALRAATAATAAVATAAAVTAATVAVATAATAAVTVATGTNSGFISARISGRAFLPIPYGAGRFLPSVFYFSLFSTRPATSGKRAKNYLRNLCFSRKKR